MHDAPPSSPNSETGDAESKTTKRLLRWAVVVLAGALILAFPPPEGITQASWRLLAIFVATITGSILRPIAGGAMVLLGISAVAVSGALPVNQALAGYADPIVWMVLAAFFISRAMIKSGLGRRIAMIFIRAIGRHSLGLGYALVATDFVLASVIPSNAARAGGIIFPIAKSLSEAYDSRPGETATRLGAFLMTMLYQSDVIICATFLTGQASNVLIAKFAQQTIGIDLSYRLWFLAAIVPALASLLVVPQLIYRVNAPEIRHTPAAAEFAAGELRRMGRMNRAELILVVVFAFVALLWSLKGLSFILPFAEGGNAARIVAYAARLDYSIPPLVGVCVLLVTGVLDWSDIIGERAAWDVFIWYGGLVRLAGALGETGITTRFAQVAGNLTTGWHWWAAMVVLLLIYFYTHYGFASITAHATAMYTPFLLVMLSAGTPSYLAMLSLAYFSNLDACLTHYGTTPAPIYFGAGYVTQRTWWILGLLASLVTIPIWLILGVAWWKVLGLW